MRMATLSHRWRLDTIRQHTLESDYATLQEPSGKESPMPNAARLELPTCPDGKLIQLAELAGINCIHLVTVSERDAVEALTGLVLYHHLSSQDRAAVHEHRRTLPSPFRAALDRVQERFAHGSVQWDETRR